MADSVRTDFVMTGKDNTSNFSSRTITSMGDNSFSNRTEARQAVAVDEAQQLYNETVQQIQQADQQRHVQLNEMVFKPDADFTASYMKEKIPLLQTLTDATEIANAKSALNNQFNEIIKEKVDMLKNFSHQLSTNSYDGRVSQTLNMLQKNVETAVKKLPEVTAGMSLLEFQEAMTKKVASYAEFEKFLAGPVQKNLHELVHYIHSDSTEGLTQLLLESSSTISKLKMQLASKKIEKQAQSIAPELTAVKLHGGAIVDMQDQKQIEESKVEEGKVNISELLQQQRNVKDFKTRMYNQLADKLFDIDNSQLKPGLKYLAKDKHLQGEIQTSIKKYAYKYNQMGETPELITKMADRLLDSKAFERMVVNQLDDMKERLHQTSGLQLQLTPQTMQTAILSSIVKAKDRGVFALEAEAYKSEYDQYLNFVRDVQNKEYLRLKQMEADRKQPAAAPAAPAKLGKRTLMEAAQLDGTDKPVAGEEEEFKEPPLKKTAAQLVQEPGESFIAFVARQMAQQKKELKMQQRQEAREKGLPPPVKEEKTISRVRMAPNKAIVKAQNIAAAFERNLGVSHGEMNLEDGVKSRGTKKKEGIVNDNARESKKDLKFSDGWGETSKASFDKALGIMKSTGLDRQDGPPTKFLDIGSGLGKILYQAAFNTDRAKIVGVEIDSARSQGADLAFAQIKKQMPKNTELERVSLIGKTAVEEMPDFGGATHIFAFSKVMTPETVKNIVQKFAADPTTEVLSITQDLRSIKKMLPGVPFDFLQEVGKHKNNMVAGKGAFTQYYFQKAPGATFGSLPPVYKAPEQPKAQVVVEEEKQEEPVQQFIAQSNEAGYRDPEEDVEEFNQAVEQKKEEEDEEEDVGINRKKRKRFELQEDLNTFENGVASMKSQLEESKQMLDALPDSSEKAVSYKKQKLQEIANLAEVVNNPSQFLDVVKYQVEIDNAEDPNDKTISDVDSMIEIKSNVAQLHQNVSEQYTGLNKVVFGQDQGPDLLQMSIDQAALGHAAYHNLSESKLLHPDMTQEERQAISDQQQLLKQTTYQNMQQVQQQTGLPLSTIQNQMAQPRVVYPYNYNSQQTMHQQSGLLLPAQLANQVFNQAFPGRFGSQQPGMPMMQMPPSPRAVQQQMQQQQMQMNEQAHRHSMEKSHQELEFAKELVTILKPEQQLQQAFPPKFILSQHDDISNRPAHMITQQLEGQLPSTAQLRGQGVVTELLQMRDAPANVVMNDIHYRNQIAKIDEDEKAEFQQKKAKVEKKLKASLQMGVGEQEERKQQYYPRRAVATLGKSLQSLRDDRAAASEALERNLNEQVGSTHTASPEKREKMDRLEKELTSKIQLYDKQISEFTKKEMELDSKMASYRTTKDKDLEEEKKLAESKYSGLQRQKDEEIRILKKDLAEAQRKRTLQERTDENDVKMRVQLATDDAMQKERKQRGDDKTTFQNTYDHMDAKYKKELKAKEDEMEQSNTKIKKLEEEKKQLRHDREEAIAAQNQQKRDQESLIRGERHDAVSREQDKRLDDDTKHNEAIVNLNTKFNKTLGEKSAEIQKLQGEVSLAKKKAEEYDKFVKKYGTDANGELTMSNASGKVIKRGQSAQMEWENDVKASDKIAAELRALEFKLQAQMYEISERSTNNTNQIALGFQQLQERKRRTDEEMKRAESESDRQVTQAKLDHLNKLTEITTKLKAESQNQSDKLEKEYTLWKQKFDSESFQKNKELTESIRQFNEEQKQEDKKDRRLMFRWQEEMKEKRKAAQDRQDSDLLRLRTEFAAEVANKTVNYERLLIDKQAIDNKYSIEEKKLQLERDRVFKEASDKRELEEKRIDGEIEKLKEKRATEKIAADKLLSEQEHETRERKAKFVEEQTARTENTDHEMLRQYYASKLKDFHDERAVRMDVMKAELLEEVNLPRLQAQMNHELSKIDYDFAAKAKLKKAEAKIELKRVRNEAKYQEQRAAVSAYHEYNQNVNISELRPYVKQVYGLLNSDFVVNWGVPAQDRLDRNEQRAQEQIAGRVMESVEKRSQRFDPNEFKNERLMSTEAELANPETDKSNARRVRLLGAIDKLEMQANEQQKRFKRTIADQTQVETIMAEASARFDPDSDRFAELDDALVAMQAPLIEISAHILKDINNDEFVDPIALLKLQTLTNQVEIILQAASDAPGYKVTQANAHKRQAEKMVELRDAALTHNENLGKVFERTLGRQRDELQSKIDKFELQEERERQRNRLADSADTTIMKHLQRLGLNGQGNQLDQLFGGGGERKLGGMGGQQQSSSSSQPFQGRSQRQNYVSDRTDQVFGANRNRQGMGGLGFQQQQQRMGDDQRQWDANEQHVQQTQNQITNKYENAPGQGKSVSGQYGPSLSVGTGLQKLGKQVSQLTESDMELLKSLIVDKTTGQAMKIDANGNVVTLSPDEREQAAKIIIEICLFVLSKQIKSISEQMLSKYRSQIQENFGDKDEDLIPLLKVANSIANKLSQGKSQGQATERSIKALAGNTFNDNDDNDQDMKIE